ncbi:MAG: hypothetical protein JEZ06_24060 [Anaerolineaceae bacterium]|nr:hypothetical protein [Anaerolineaceae bacterium]
MKSKKYKDLYLLLFFIIGYFLVMGPWFIRNIIDLGVLMPQAGYKTIWLTNYNDFFLFTTDELNPQNWLGIGWQEHLNVRFDALIYNLQTSLLVQTEIFLLPLIIFGFYHLRNKDEAKAVVIFWGAILFIMTLVFPLAGRRGGFLHSGSSVQIMFFILAAEGFDRVLIWMSKMRKWNYEEAYRFLSIGLIGLAIIFTALIFIEKVGSNNLTEISWDDSYEHYKIIEAQIQDIGSAEGRVMVNNPPGYYLVSRRQAVVIPWGDIDTVVSAANKYDCDYLILEKTNESGLQELYQNPKDFTELSYIETIGDTHLFSFE